MLTPAPLFALTEAPLLPHPRLEGEFYGIPSHLIRRPLLLPWLMRYLSRLERDGWEPTDDGPWPTLGRLPGFDPVRVYSGYRRVWRVQRYGVVVKYHRPTHAREYHRTNAFEYDRSMDLIHQRPRQGVHVHFPVWGITPKTSFLVMALADAAPGCQVQSELLSAVRLAAQRAGTKPDGNCANFGVMLDGTSRYWAVLDLDQKVEVM